MALEFTKVNATKMATQWEKAVGSAQSHHLNSKANLKALRLKVVSRVIFLKVLVSMKSGF